MNLLISSSVIVLIFGSFLAVWGFVFGKRTGKLAGYAVLLVGLGLIVLGVLSIVSANAMKLEYQETKTSVASLP